MFYDCSERISKMCLKFGYKIKSQNKLKIKTFAFSFENLLIIYSNNQKVCLLIEMILNDSTNKIPFLHICFDREKIKTINEYNLHFRSFVEILFV